MYNDIDSELPEGSLKERKLNFNIWPTSKDSTRNWSNPKAKLNLCKWNN